MEELPLDPTDPTVEENPTTEPAATEDTPVPAAEPVPEVELTPEQKAELEKRRKRAERFGTALDEVAALTKTTPKRENPKAAARKQAKEEERKKIEEREKRFGLVVTKMRNDKHFLEKVENPVSEDNKLRPEALYVFGVDFLSTGDIMKFFKAYNPVKVEWINDSSCNIVFNSEETCQDAYKDLTLTKKYDTCWRESFPIEKEGTKFTLEFRFATEKDVKSEDTTGKSSKYYQFVKEKKQEYRERNKDSGRYRDSYDSNSKFHKKGISKKGQKKGKDGDKEEEGDEELKKLREEQTAEGLKENEAEEGDQAGEGANQEAQNNNAANNNEEKNEPQDQDLDL